MSHGALVDERALPEQVLDLLRERFTFQQGDAHLFLAYLVPGADGAIEAGKRRVNWVWYRRLASDRLRSLFVARDGTQRDGSLPPGAMRDDNRAGVVDAGGRMLAPTLAALVDATPAPFAQAIQDLAVERMAVGRAVLLGDAACSFARTRRPVSRKRRTTRSASRKRCVKSATAAGSTPRWRAGTPVSAASAVIAARGIALGARLMGAANVGRPRGRAGAAPRSTDRARAARWRARHRRRAVAAGHAAAPCAASNAASADPPPAPVRQPASLRARR